MIQPNKWSCMVTAAAIVYETTIDRMIHLIGHDGSKILWPELPDPDCRQGFHPQEIIEAGIYMRMPSCYLEKIPMIEQNGAAYAIKDSNVLERKFESYLRRSRSVLIGRAGQTRHAWANTQLGIFDPSTGEILSYGEFVLRSYVLDSMILRF